MQTIPTTYNSTYNTTAHKQSAITQFINWCGDQEKSRYGWLAAILALHGCVLLPITMLTIVAGGTSIVLLSLALGAMASSLITNLAAMSMKTIIPVFVLSVLVDLVVLVISISHVL